MFLRLRPQSAPYSPTERYTVGLTAYFSMDLLQNKASGQSQPATCCFHGQFIVWIRIWNWLSAPAAADVSISRFFLTLSWRWHDMTCQASVMKLHDLDALSVGFPEFGVAALHGIYVSQFAGVREAQGASEWTSDQVEKDVSQFTERSWRIQFGIIWIVRDSIRLELLYLHVLATNASQRLKIHKKVTSLHRMVSNTGSICRGEGMMLLRLQVLWVGIGDAWGCVCMLTSREFTNFSESLRSRPGISPRSLCALAVYSVRLPGFTVLESCWECGLPPLDMPKFKSKYSRGKHLMILLLFFHFLCQKWTARADFFNTDGDNKAT